MSGTKLITRRRKWCPTQKAALLEEVEDDGGNVAVVTRRHGISESLLYNWRSAWKAAESATSAVESVAFVPLGIVSEAGGPRRPVLAPPEADRSPTLRPAQAALEQSRSRCRTVFTFVLLAW